MLSVCMVLAILAPASAADLSANYNTASYYDVAVSAYSRMLAFQNGVVAQSGERYQEGVLNSSYEPIIPLGSVDNVECAVNGDSVAFVVSKDRQYKLVGSDGRDIVPFGVYDDFRVRSQGGSVGVSKGGKVVKTFSDKKVTTEVYYRHMAFTTGSTNNGMVDVNGKVILPEKYYTIGVDSNNYLCASHMREDGSYEYLSGLFTQEGAEVIPDTYTEIRVLQGSSYVLCKDGSYGLSRISGATVTPVIPMRYQEMRTYTPQFIQLYDGSKYSVVVPESTQEIDAFKGDEGGLWETLDRVNLYAEEYDGYTKSVLPFISTTGSGYLTTYADYKTGEAGGQLPVRASNLNGGGWFAYQNADGLYGIGRLSTGFLDVEPESWKDDSASWAAARKITDGVGGGRFDPDRNCTNAQIITFLYRAKTGNIVSGDNWDADAINWAREQGMIGGAFDKAQPCTRATALKYIWQAFGSPHPEKASSFTDIPAGADYADAVSWAVGLPTPITNGYGAAFGPNDVCSRAHIVTFLYRAYGNS